MTEDLLRTVPPNSSDAERSVLGAALQDSDAATLSVEMLQADDFYVPEHQEIFSAIKELQTNGESVDVMTVSNALSKRGTLDGVGGSSYLLSACRYVPTTANTKSYIKIVLEKSSLRRTIAACRVIEEQCYTQMEETEVILRNAECAMTEIAQRRGEADTMHHIQTVMMDTFDDIEKLSRLKGKLAGIPTGLHELDKMLTGLHGGELIIAAGRPGMGKTSLALGILKYAAVKAHKKAGFFSMEMPKNQIGLRLICSAANIDIQKVRSGSLVDEEWMRIGDALNQLSQTDIYIDDAVGLTPIKLRNRLKKAIITRGLDIAFVDYLGLMDSDKKSENTNQKISDISKALKGIALELKIPLVVCAQLSRANTARADKRPQLNDIRDSGSIEQDADVILFIHREGYYKPREEQEDDTEGEIIVAKQRNGPVGTVSVQWVAKYARYENEDGTLVPQFTQNEEKAPF